MSRTVCLSSPTNSLFTQSRRGLREEGRWRSGKDHIRSPSKSWGCLRLCVIHDTQTLSPTGSFRTYTNGTPDGLRRCGREVKKGKWGYDPDSEVERCPPPRVVVGGPPGRRSPTQDSVGTVVRPPPSVRPGQTHSPSGGGRDRGKGG